MKLEKQNAKLVAEALAKEGLIKPEKMEEVITAITLVNMRSPMMANNGGGGFFPFNLNAN